MTDTTWDARHHRGDVLRAVVEAADSTRDGALPRDVPGVAATFADDFALVTALQMRWHTRLAGSIERALTDQPADLETAVLRAWRDAAADLVGVRAILDAQAAEPATPELGTALERARRKDWVLLASMAGRANPSDSRALAVGRELEQQARAAYDPTAAPRHRSGDGDRTGHQGGTLLDRLKAHLAA